ncbi:nucleoside-diphosphate kinase [Candidatus Woesearchaeota archaeon]|nr:nucleoside-diphosphate kinase [Candidatus Woesearchaeota archaeon]
MIERTLVLLKPDAVQREIMGKIISRFEDAGLKIVGVKMVWADTAFARKHYDEIGEVGKRRGEKVLQHMLKVLSSGPVLALCIEGVNAVENVRKMAGATEPKAAPPGTIRGDFSHTSFAHADQLNKGVENVIHASGSIDDATKEISLWFSSKELHNYKTVHEAHVF